MWFINALAHILPAYRAAQDAENGLPNQGPMVQNYLVCWLIDRAVKDRGGHSQS